MIKNEIRCKQKKLLHFLDLKKQSNQRKGESNKALNNVIEDIVNEIRFTLFQHRNVKDVRVHNLYYLIILLRDNTKLKLNLSIPVENIDLKKRKGKLI